MNLAKRSRYSGKEIGEVLERAAEELTVDAVSLYSIVGSARDEFSLNEADTTEFVRRYLTALAQEGAVPVVGALDRVDVDWVRRNYHEQWVEPVIEEWIASGKDPGPGEGIWFANPACVSVGLTNLA